MELHSDQASNFKSQVFGKVAQLFGLRKSRTKPALHPQSNGMDERFNKTTNQFLSKVVYMVKRFNKKTTDQFLLKVVDND